MYIDRAIILRDAIKFGSEYAYNELINNKNDFAGGKDNYNDLINMFTMPDYIERPDIWFKG